MPASSGAIGAARSRSSGCHSGRCSHRRMSACSAAQTGVRPATTCHHDGCGPRCPPIRSRNARVYFSVNWTNSSNGTPQVRAESPSGKEQAPPIPCLEPKPDLIDHAWPSSAPAARPPAVTHHREESRFDIPTRNLRQRLAEEGSTRVTTPRSASCVPLLSVARTDKSTRIREKMRVAKSPRSRHRPRHSAVRRRTHGRDEGTSVIAGTQGLYQPYKSASRKKSPNFTDERRSGDSAEAGEPPGLRAHGVPPIAACRGEGHGLLVQGGGIERDQDEGEGAEPVEGRVQDERGDEAPRPLVERPQPQ